MRARRLPDRFRSTRRRAVARECSRPGIRRPGAQRFQRTSVRVHVFRAPNAIAGVETLGRIRDVARRPAPILQTLPGRLFAEERRQPCIPDLSDPPRRPCDREWRCIVPFWSQSDEKPLLRKPPPLARSLLSSSRGIPAPKRDLRPRAESVDASRHQPFGPLFGAKGFHQWRLGVYSIPSVQS